MWFKFVGHEDGIEEDSRAVSYIAGPRVVGWAGDRAPGGVSRAFRAGLVFRGGELTKNVPFCAVPVCGRVWLPFPCRR